MLYQEKSLLAGESGWVSGENKTGIIKLTWEKERYSIVIFCIARRLKEIKIEELDASAKEMKIMALFNVCLSELAFSKIAFLVGSFVVSIAMSRYVILFQSEKTGLCPGVLKIYWPKKDNRLKQQRYKCRCWVFSLLYTNFSLSKLWLDEKEHLYV